ncbi:MAG TPA: hypothetical protein VH678_26785 [Xanthobacteraceae bacterium]
MQSFPRLGSVNAALVAVYFAPVWGGDALRALTSPFYGFDDRVHAVAVGYFRALLDLHLDGLVQLSNLLAGTKLVLAIGFLAFLIDFVRALVVGREVDRATLDTVLVVSVIALMLWAGPALCTGDPGLVRIHVTQYLLLSSAMIVILIERQIEESRSAVETPIASATRQCRSRSADNPAVPYCG